MPHIPTNFGHLNDLSTAELQNLADDEGKLIEFLRSLPELKKVSQDQQKLFEQNEKLASESLHDTITAVVPILRDHLHERPLSWQITAHATL